MNLVPVFGKLGIYQSGTDFMVEFYRARIFFDNVVQVKDVGLDDLDLLGGNLVLVLGFGFELEVVFQAGHYQYEDIVILVWEEFE